MLVASIATEGEVATDGGVVAPGVTAGGVEDAASEVGFIVYINACVLTFILTSIAIFLSSLLLYWSSLMLCDVPGAYIL